MGLTGWRQHIAAALEYTPTHTLEDIEAGVDAGFFVLWQGERSAIVTEIQDYPRAKFLHFFLAGGDIEELARMVPYIEAAGRKLGCTHMSLGGRRGWLKSFLKDQGYAEAWTVMLKGLT